LQEQKLSQSELFDRSTAIRLGKMVAAQSMVAGSIIESHTGIEIVARLIDTETSEILATEDVYDEVKELSAMRKLAEGLALKIHNEFPLVEGIVVLSKGDQIFTNMGEDKTKLKRRLIVYREEVIEDPDTGMVLGADTIILGNARVVQVQPKMSKAELSGEPADAIQKKDKVITQ
jgi:hypothetical protein